MSRFANAIFSLSVFWFTCDLQAAEVIGHISDDTEPAALPTAQPQSDRQIIYRVICSPDGEALPDCERPFADQEAVQKPIADEPVPDAGDMADEEIAEPAPEKKPAKTPVKKAKSTKKTAGKKTNSKNKSKASAKKNAKKAKANKH